MSAYINVTKDNLEEVQSQVNELLGNLNELKDLYTDYVYTIQRDKSNIDYSGWQDDVSTEVQNFADTDIDTAMERVQTDLESKGYQSLIYVTEKILEQLGYCIKAKAQLDTYNTRLEELKARRDAETNYSSLYSSGQASQAYINYMNQLDSAITKVQGYITKLNTEIDNMITRIQEFFRKLSEIKFGDVVRNLAVINTYTQTAAPEVPTDPGAAAKEPVEVEQEAAEEEPDPKDPIVEEQSEEEPDPKDPIVEEQSEEEPDSKNPTEEESKAEFIERMTSAGLTKEEAEEIWNNRHLSEEESSEEEPTEEVSKEEFIEQMTSAGLTKEEAEEIWNNRHPSEEEVPDSKNPTEEESKAEFIERMTSAGLTKEEAEEIWNNRHPEAAKDPVEVGQETADVTESLTPSERKTSAIAKLTEDYINRGMSEQEAAKKAAATYQEMINKGYEWDASNKCFKGVEELNNGYYMAKHGETTVGVFRTEKDAQAALDAFAATNSYDLTPKSQPQPQSSNYSGFWLQENHMGIKPGTRPVSLEALTSGERLVADIVEMEPSSITIELPKGVIIKGSKDVLQNNLHYDQPLSRKWTLSYHANSTFAAEFPAAYYEGGEVTSSADLGILKTGLTGVTVLQPVESTITVPSYQAETVTIPSQATVNFKNDDVIYNVRTFPAGTYTPVDIGDEVYWVNFGTNSIPDLSRKSPDEQIAMLSAYNPIVTPRAEEFSLTYTTYQEHSIFEYAHIDYQGTDTTLYDLMTAKGDEN